MMLVGLSDVYRWRWRELVGGDTPQTPCEIVSRMSGFVLFGEDA